VSTVRGCSFYRDSGIGYCDLDGNQTTCNGDLNSCEDVKFSETSDDDVTQYLQGRLDEFGKTENKER
jgi:hypothetical protein